MATDEEAARALVQAWDQTIDYEECESAEASNARLVPMIVALLADRRRNMQLVEADVRAEYLRFEQRALAAEADVARLKFALGVGDELSRKSVKEITRLREEARENQEAIRATAETAADWMRVSIGRVTALVDLIAFLTEALGSAAAEAHVRCLGCDREPFTACRDEHCRTVALAWAKSREWCAKVKAWTWR